MDVQPQAVPSPSRASRLASSASRLQVTFSEHAYTLVAQRSDVVDKVRFISAATTDLATRYAAQLEAAWSRRVPLLERDLADLADYSAVLCAPGRPQISEPEIRRLEAVADQLLDALNGVAGDLFIGEIGRSNPPAPGDTDKLAVVAASYREDARIKGRATRAFFYAAALPVVSTLGFLLWGLFRTVFISGSGTSAHESVWTIFSIYLVASLVSLTVAVILFLGGERHRKAAEESARLACQFDAVEAYLEPMEPPVRDLVRASLTPRLFSRILWDTDPLREPIWPTAQDMISAHRPRHQRRNGSP